jgi:hypothetical protein
MPGTLPGSGPMDTPPPSPSVPGGGVGGQMPTLSGLAQPAPIGSANIPPELLTGIIQAAQKIDGIFDSFAQVTPDLAADLDLCKTVLQRYLGKVMAAGGGATSPNAPGPQFPGGGMNSGMPAQAVGGAAAA